MAIVKIKAVKNLIDFSRYVLDQKRHRKEKIVEVNDYKQNLDKQLELIEEYQQQKKDKRGRRPRQLSLIVAMKENQTIEQVTMEYKNILKGFYDFVNRENRLQLSEHNINKLISETPSVLHYGKNRSGHFHLLLNRVISSKKENRLITIDLSKKIYHRELMRLSGHKISQQIQNKSNKPLYNHKLEKLEEQFKQYQNINEKLDKFILIALNDLKKGRSTKALKKLNKIKQAMS